MSSDELAGLPVANKLGAKDCACFMWCTFPQIDVGLHVMDLWGFKFKTVAFVWIKLNQNVITKRSRQPFIEAGLKSPFFGLGRWSRGNAEIVLLGTKGKPKRLDNAVPQLIFHQRLRHSAKPPCVRGRISRLMGDVPRIELFARERAEGWDATGLEIDGKDIRDVLK